MRRKKFRPAGVEFDGKCRQVEAVASQVNVPYRSIRLAEYLFFNGTQWTVRSVFETEQNGQWVELDWSPKTHSMSKHNSPTST